MGVPTVRPVVMLLVGVVMVRPGAVLQAAVVKGAMLVETIVELAAVVVIGLAVFMKYFSSLALMCLP